MNKGNSRTNRPRVFGLKLNSQFSHLTEAVLNDYAANQFMKLIKIKKTYNSPGRFVTKKATGALPGNICFIFMKAENITMGKARSIVKHSAACKATDSATGKEGKRKKRNDKSSRFWIFD